MEEAEDKRVKKVIAFDGDDEESLQIRSFFSLIRSYRKARECLMTKEDRSATTKRRRTESTAAMARGCGAWVPSFEKADFTEEIEFGVRSKLPLPCTAIEKASTSTSSEDNKGLDLTLSL